MRRITRSRTLPVRDQINILLEEYRALYGLAAYRLSSLEGRVPVFGAALTAFVGSVAVIPPGLQMVVLFALPIVCFWFVRTTVNHARSLEDVLRRVDEIECAINLRAGDELLRFQSSHPSRGKATGGRIGTGTVHISLVTTLLLLGACNYLLAVERAASHPLLIGYAAFALGVLLLCLREVRNLIRYRYPMADER